MPFNRLYWYSKAVRSSTVVCMLVFLNLGVIVNFHWGTEALGEIKNVYYYISSFLYRRVSSYWEAYEKMQTKTMHWLIFYSVCNLILFPSQPGGSLIYGCKEFLLVYLLFSWQEREFISRSLRKKWRWNARTNFFCDILVLIIFPSKTRGNLTYGCIEFLSLYLLFSWQERKFIRRSL